MSPEKILYVANFTIEKRITDKKLRKLWDEHYKDKPFPQVEAYIVSDRSFTKAEKQAMEMELQREARLKEYGYLPESPKSVMACVMETADGLRIFVRKNHKPGLNEILNHELGHIYNGDVNAT